MKSKRERDFYDEKVTSERREGRPRERLRERERDTHSNKKTSVWK